MKMYRHCSFPNKWTFLIPPIEALLKQYVGDGKGWIDPFAGEHSPAEYTNDLHPDRPTAYHMLAYDFCAIMIGPFQGVLFDPPYSPRQVKEAYEDVGLHPHMEDTQSSFYGKVKKEIAHKIVSGGYAISFGWNSSGFGEYLGFQLVEVHLICHHGNRNDTIVTVERKVQPSLW